MRWLSIVLALSLPLLILLHLYISPFTKVEESFNLQATHDIIKHGLPTEYMDITMRTHYDHLSFPGSVPRTFVGPLVLSGISTPLVKLFPDLDQQVLVRGILGLYNAFALVIFGRSLSKAYGQHVGNWYLLLQASQFHVIYYASRPLPNMFAFGLTTMACSRFLPTGRNLTTQSQRRHRLGLYLLTLAGVIFRAEIALYILSLVTYHLWVSRMEITKVIIPGAITGALVGLVVSVPIDTYFWRSSTPLWPELHGFIFNVVNRKASEWGISPWHYYFSNSVPRLMLNPLCLFLLLPLPILLVPTRKAALGLIVPPLMFVALYSAQPHKEWRFIIYIVPQLTAASALGANWIWTRRTKSAIYQFLSMLLIASIMASLIGSTAMALVSSYNYPGGNALLRLHEIADGSRRVVNVHMDVLSCMSGVSRFQERRTPGLSFWIYDKTEDPETLLRPEFWDRFDYVLAERPEKVIGSWEIIDTVYGFAGVGLVNEPENRRHHERKSEKLRGHLQWLEHWLKTKVTKGYWARIKLKPQVQILRKQVKSPI